MIFFSIVENSYDSQLIKEMHVQGLIKQSYQKRNIYIAREREREYSNNL